MLGFPSAVITTIDPVFPETEANNWINTLRIATITGPDSPVK